MREPKWRRLVATSALAAAVLVASPAGSAEDDDPPPLLEPAPEALVEPVPATRALRLQEAAVRSTNLCDLMPKLDELGEPLPHDLDELLEWATRFHTLLKTYDPASKVDDPSRRNRQVKPPEAVTNAIAVERAAVYAYSQRLTYTKALSDSGDITSGEVERRLDYALQQLVRSPFTAADRYVTGSSELFCTGG